MPASEQWQVTTHNKQHFLGRKYIFFLYYIAAKLDPSHVWHRAGKSRGAPRKAQWFMKGGRVWIRQEQNCCFSLSDRVASLETQHSFRSISFFFRK